MNRHVTPFTNGVVFLAGLILLGLAAGLTRAQESGPEQAVGELAAQAPATIAPGAIPVQGRLTSASGAPLNGTYTTTFRLYEDATATIALCADVRPVNVVNGLFSDYIDHCYDDIYGQKLWLGVQVQGDPEMTPRQVIFPVPYALSLVPGAVISTYNSTALTLRTTHATGTALQGAALSATGKNYGVSGSSNSSDGYGGYFYNYMGGIGVSGISLAGPGVYAGSLGTALRASSGTGAAIAAEGTGRITSTAKSYLWISGNGLRPWNQSDSTVIDMDTIGGARITRGATPGHKNVMLPITILGPLYGQDVRITAVDIYWVADMDMDGIAAVLLRRQTGVCDTASCYASIIHDSPPGGYSCQDNLPGNATGCTRHYAPTSNNALSANSGILYLTLELAFDSNSWIRIGGVRLTLEHD